MKSAILAFLLLLHATYPAATLQDVYKSCYQDRFGVEHLIPDSSSAARYLHQELAAMDTTLILDNECCGYSHQHERVSLALIRRGELSEQELIGRMLADRVPHSSRDSAGWVREWKQIEEIALEQYPEWRDSSLQTALTQCAEQLAPVHHSEAYRQAYKPHYRVVKKK